MTTKSGGWSQGCPPNLRLSLSSSLSLSRWKTRGIAGRCRGQTRDVISGENRPRWSQQGFSRGSIFQEMGWFLETSIGEEAEANPTSRIPRLLGRNLGQFADVTYLTILEIVSINLSEFWQFSRAFFRRSLPLFVTRVFEGIVTFDLDKGKKDLDYLFWRKLFRRVFDSFLLVENEMLIDLIFWLYSIVSDRIISLFKAVIANRCVTMHWKNCENSYRENFAKIFNIYWYSYVAPFAMFFTYKFFETII